MILILQSLIGITTSCNEDLSQPTRCVCHIMLAEQHHFSLRTIPYRKSRNYVWSFGWRRIIDYTRQPRSIWVATANGLNRFDGTDFINFTMENSGLGSNALNCVTQLPNDPDRLWIGSQRDGIFYYDHASGEIHGLTHPVQISTDVTTITPASDSGMWVNYYHFGPQYINFQTGESREYTYRKIPGMPKHCWTTTEGKDGKLYVGHAGEGFSVVDTVQKKVVTFRHQEGKPSIPGNEVYSVCVDKDDDVWLGTDKGAALYLPKQNLFIPFTNDENNPNSILPGRIRHIAQDRNGNIWFASTLAGVCMLPAPPQKPMATAKPNSQGFPQTDSVYTPPMNMPGQYIRIRSEISG